TRTAGGGQCPAPALGDEEACRDGDICRHLDRRGRELPCPRTAGAAAGPTHDHPSRRRTSRAWSMGGGAMCFQGSTMTDHSVYVVRYAQREMPAPHAYVLPHLIARRSPAGGGQEPLPAWP